MRVRFRSLAGQQQVTMPLDPRASITRDRRGKLVFGEASLDFKDGEARDVTDDVATYALRNPNFVDDATGANPNFTCAIGGEPTHTAVAFLTPDNRLIAYRDAAGQALCVDHFLEQYPEWKPWHDVRAALARGEHIPDEDIDDAITVAQRIDLFHAPFLQSFGAEPRGGATPLPSDAQARLDRRFRAQSFAQPTFPEVKRVAQGLADGSDGQRWSKVVGDFALRHVIERATHDLTLEGDRLPVWWGRPNDSESLLAELQGTGLDGVATLYNAIGLVLLSEHGHVDIELDDIIALIGIDPRSKLERADARLKVWRILTVLSALCVIGQRKKSIRDRVTGKMVTIGSDDALLNVRAWRAVGTQETFDAGVAPLMATISASPWLSKYRHDRRVLSDFGSLLQVSKIPIGKPSGAWARAIGWALQQLWREGATHASTSYSRTGHDHKRTVKFRSYTRRELLELFPPEPRVQDVLKSANPSRAIQYWDAAIQELKDRQVIGHVGTSKDWKIDRPRKGWESSWLDEPLDIRPASDATAALGEIAGSAKRLRRGSLSKRTPAPTK